MMDLSLERPEVTLHEGFVRDPLVLMQKIKEVADWRKMRARWTASFGVPYNYSGMTYPEIALPPELQELCRRIQPIAGFLPDNCLANLYLSGGSRMGFHSDDDLAPGTGVAIVSLGSERTLRFRLKEHREATCDFPLPDGSLLYMAPGVQIEWQHGVPEQVGAGERISLTFRKISSKARDSGL